MEFFLNPFYMVAGGALVSSPIVIHLINRMRFRRIRWAAMEFLLKSQKRNRRRLIIEQIILLLLRCLLVLLAAILVARYVGPSLGMAVAGTSTQVVLLDDTLSMTDRNPKREGRAAQVADAFTNAKAQIELLARYASEAPSPPLLRVITMSQGKVVYEAKLNQKTLGELSASLKNVNPTAVHVDPVAALETAKAALAESKDSKRQLHIVGDFREVDWGRRAGNERVHTLLAEITKHGTHVNLIDVADPERATAANKGVDHHSNYAVNELRPEKRIAPAGTIVPFTVEIENLGTATRDSLFLEVYVNGKADFEASRFYDAPSPGAKVVHKFDLLFEGPPAEVKSRYHRVTARAAVALNQPLDAESGLHLDNVRHAVIEVRKEVPTLVIDGAPEEGARPGGDTSSIRSVLESAKGSEAVKVVSGDLEELKRPDLAREYATIYILNVENLRGAKGKEGNEESIPLQRLRDYVKNGGNVVFFTGDKVDVKYYNDVLFEENKGLFPVPLERQRSDRMTQEAMEKARKSMAPKIFVLDKEHDSTRGIGEVQFKIPDLIIPQHTVAKDRFEWKRDWAQETDLKELITLATPRKLENSSRKEIQDLLKKVPIDDANYVKYKPLLEKHRDLILDAARAGKEDELYKVAEAFDNMLVEPGAKPTEKDNVSLVEFWSKPEMKDLKTYILDFRKSALYGSPLVMTRKYGKGNVAAVLTTAGTEWSGWPGGKEGGAASFSYPVFVIDLQRFLTRGGDGGERMMGDKIDFQLPSAQYSGKVQRVVQADEGEADPKRNDPDKAPPGMASERMEERQANAGLFTIGFDNLDKPGVQMFRLFRQGKDDPEEQWFAFNVDTRAESNLRRAATEDIAVNVANPDPAQGKIRVLGQGVEVIQDSLRDKQNDLSESWWLYLLILAALIIEQALAVHLSFHAKGGDATHTGSLPAAAASASPAAAISA